MASNDYLFDIINDCVKTQEEIDEENKHGWEKLDPPQCCFINMFPKEYALNPDNEINVFPEHFWLKRNIRLLKQRIKQHRYKDDGEREYFERKIKLYEQQLDVIMCM